MFYDKGPLDCASVYHSVMKLFRVRTRFYFPLKLLITQTHLDSPFAFEPAKFNCIYLSIYIYIYFFISHSKFTERFSLDILVSSTNKTGRHDITEILLKVAFYSTNLQRYREMTIYK